MSKKLKITFIVIVVIAVIFFGSRLVGNGNNESVSPLSSEGVQTSSFGVDPMNPQTLTIEGVAEFATLLSVLQSVQLDTTVFTNSTFTSLKDNAVDLGDVLVGRVNPFIRVGQDTGGVFLSQLKSQALTIETVQPDPIAVRTTSADFSAYVEFQGETPVEVFFQYGTQGGETKLTPPNRVTSTGFVKVTVSDLVPGQTYTVSSIGVRGANRQTGSTMTFTTKTQ